jgi:hypothetical protein
VSCVQYPLGVPWNSHPQASETIMSMFEINTSAYKNNVSHSTLLHVGKPPTDFQDWVRACVYFHGFADIPIDGEEVISSTFWCLGYGLMMGLSIVNHITFDETGEEMYTDVIAFFKIYQQAK